MKTRFARKLLRRQFNRLPPYWYQRVCAMLDGDKRDHRVSEAFRMIDKLKQKEKQKQ